MYLFCNYLPSNLHGVKGIVNIVNINLNNTLTLMMTGLS